MENLSRRWNHTPDPKGHRASGVPAGDRGVRLPFINCAKMWSTGGRRAKDDPQNQCGIEVGTNYLLACLDSKDLHQLKSHLVTTTVNRGEVLAEWDQQPERIWFPVTCVVSLVVAMNAGNDVTVGLIGREGATELRFGRQIVLLPGSACFLPIDTKQTAPDVFPALRQLLLRHGDALRGQVVQLAACNALHSLDARLARFLLSIEDRIGLHAELRLTQEDLAHALLVQRTTVNARATELQRLGLITYQRGVITVQNRAGLQAIACECYGTVRSYYNTLLAQRS